jgi:hypothetical protein
MNLVNRGQWNRSTAIGGNERERCRGLPVNSACDDCSIRELRPRGRFAADDERSGGNRQQRDSGRQDAPAEPANFAEVLRLSRESL